ncbi:chemotaxis protein CheW [Colwellia sp. E150_009]|jgi:purine-binding chemotaxis protein CheW|tara:strand:+ start:1441 stop:1935 length:495 start_codon:yes stop_codon:yes gene_type:complete
MSDERRISNGKTGEKDEVLQWVTFKLENEVYGINVMQVQEVLRYSEIAPVPGAPVYVLGIINLRGNVVTVIDTRARFGLAPREVTDNTRVVVIESEKQVIGILVDSVAEVVYLKASEIDDAPNVGNEESAQFIQGVSNREGELLILVDLDKLLSDDEWDELKQF